MEIEKFYSICLQGNILEAIEYLRLFKDKNEDAFKLEKQFTNRFLTQEESWEINSEDSWIKDVVKYYFIYFRSVLTDNSIDEAEKQLISSLSNLLRIKDYDLDEIESELKNVFKEKGYSFLGGVTKPYRGPYIWKKTQQKDFKVLLPGGEQKVTVYIISDFLMLSWAHFATMGKYYSGGWAKKEGLYYVNNSSEEIDIYSTDFQVWFLKHEAQHLSDYEKYPNLNAINLEYRAKLIELIYKPNPYSLIEKFVNQSNNDKSIPHPYAAYSIIKGLSLSIFGKEYVDDNEQWRNIDSNLISKEALQLFMENEKNLQDRGNETEGIL